jgi:transcription antitermination factor NusG
MTWLVICSKPHQEGRAEINLGRQSSVISQVYCPYVQIFGKTRPLFPNYLFVKVLEDYNTRTIQNTYGVRSIVKIGENVATISEGNIEEIKSREEDGVVKLCPYVAGQQLKWGNFPVIFENMLDDTRCSVLFTLLGKSTHKILPVAQLDAGVR